jgi:hypothetical protein
MEESEPATDPRLGRRKWFLALVLACPPCLAAGLGSLGAGLGSLAALAGGWWIAAAALAVAGVVAGILFVRSRRACALPQAPGTDAVQP